ncbi:hypothetical protein TraAM80_00803 [Trypanosoma rangeli]|uniref:Transmembrane protein n=1 Tax=Trypanosoma rangeli TaxID=5698 RepID=A0A422P1N3_TRYRA|nr:uncharacterized protein TraAM80_00803 [Trypanosoma rangeli]RNF11611.1 hypothetical protein TraAM80_00803 [Trypanosoma rangeli]|eukprot:RNF11611.1 hypothetical protein TraAM80_00803 [Trypanosoma rangeli]
MQPSTNVSAPNVTTSTAVGSSVSLPKMVERTLSLAKTVGRNVSRAAANSSIVNDGRRAHMSTWGARRQMCDGMHGEPSGESTTMQGFNECQAVQGKEFNGLLSPPLSGSLRGGHLRSWTPFAAWFVGLLLFSVLAAALTYRFLRSRRSWRDDYEELVEEGGLETAEMGDTRASSRPDGNASRQRFLQSRRAAAQKSYDTETPTK